MGEDEKETYVARCEFYCCWVFCADGGVVRIKSARVRGGKRYCNIMKAKPRCLLD